jgi:hypothetical protein
VYVQAPFSISFYPAKGADSIEIRPADDVLQKHIGYVRPPTDF